MNRPHPLMMFGLYLVLFAAVGIFEIRRDFALWVGFWVAHLVWVWRYDNWRQS